jgi:hypothetical protein
MECLRFRNLQRLELCAIEPHNPQQGGRFERERERGRERERT